MATESQESLLDARSTFRKNAFLNYQSKSAVKDYTAMPQAEPREELMKDFAAKGSVPSLHSNPSGYQQGKIMNSQRIVPTTILREAVPSKRPSPPEFQQGPQTAPKSISKTSCVSISELLNHPAPPDSQRGQPFIPIQIDDEEESLVTAKIPVPMFATTAEFMVAYAGSHTIQLEAQHRRYRSSNIAPHGDICIVCAAKKDTYVARFACCSLKFCTDCVTYEDGNPLLAIDRFCPLCFKRGWNHMRPYFGSESPVWELLPDDYKNRYMELSHRVLKTTVCLVPEWREWQRLPDDGSLVSDRLILHALQPYSISEHGKTQLTAFAAEQSFRSTTIDGHSMQEGVNDNASRSGEPSLQWFVSKPMLPLVRFDKTIAAHEEFLSLHPTVSKPGSLKGYAARGAEDITSKEGRSREQTNPNDNREETTEHTSSSMPGSLWSSPISSPEREPLQVRQLKNFAERAKGRIAHLKEMLDSRTAELNAQQKACTQDHIPDLAAFGMELARTRGIARGNVRGVETRLQGDYLSKLPVQRLLDNPIFDQSWVHGRKERKQADNGQGWVLEDVAVKIEDDG